MQKKLIEALLMKAYCQSRTPAMMLQNHEVIKGSPRIPNPPVASPASATDGFQKAKARSIWAYTPNLRSTCTPRRWTIQNSKLNIDHLRRSCSKIRMCNQMRRGLEICRRLMYLHIKVHLWRGQSWCRPRASCTTSSRSTRKRI